ncbi:MAG: efflux transporter outer membrane subunit [Verrucomicrobia bacterium]|nr:efflux transporter outer membrane subunit [Verrucomicrobiota bacterium]
MKYIVPFLFMFSGCMVGPKYQKPDISMPAEFEENARNIDADEDLSQWWEQFNDPVLDELIAEALIANYDLRIALEKIEQTRAQYRIERSHLWPEIDLNATATRTRISQNLFPVPSTGNAAASQATGGSSFLPGFLNIFQVGFDAIWELDFFGKFRHAKKAAHYIFEATKEDCQSVLISMLSEVAVNYMGIRALQAKIELAKEKVQTDEEELAIADSLFEIGIDNEMQITTLISKLETDRAALPVLETSLKQTVYALAYLLGRQPEGLMEMFETVRPIPTGSGKVPVGLPSDLLRRRPDVRSAERQLASATEQVGEAIADYFPHFSLTGISFGAGNRGGSSIGYESNKLNKLFKSASRMFSFGMGMNWDLIDFGRVRGKVDVQNSIQRQALMTYEQTVISSLKDVESALVAYFEEENRRESLMQKVEADRRTFEIMVNLFNVGLANEIQVLESQRALIDSESAFVESEQSLAGDLIAIYKAIGGNWN